MNLEYDEGSFQERPALTPAGEARREAMLCDLKAAVVRRRRRRAVLRGAALAGCVLLAGVLVGLYVRAPRPPSGPQEVARIAPPAAPLVLASARLETVHDASGILERVAVSDRPISPSTFTDEEGLLSSLAAADRPAGLVRFEGGIVLAYHGGGAPPDADPAPR
jgi:hypothetical protein